MCHRLYTQRMSYIFYLLYKKYLLVGRFYIAVSSIFLCRLMQSLGGLLYDEAWNLSELAFYSSQTLFVYH